jgi:hypothetical protein
MLFRIEVPTASVKQLLPTDGAAFGLDISSLCIFSASPRNGKHPVSHTEFTVPGDIHEHAATSDGAMGCFFFPASRGKFPGGLL